LPLATFEPARAGEARTKRFAGHLDGVSHGDWVYLPFRVPSGVREIAVKYAYTKNDTGLGFSTNVIDIGIFDPSGIALGNAAGFRGWSGGARSEFSLSRSSATPGYIPGPITPGKWHIALGPFLMVPPGVDYTVDVTLKFGPPGRAFVPAPPPRRVDGRGAGWYRGDLHTHTVHSDGSQTQAELVAAAQAAGLDFIGSSEHNTSTAGLTWGKYVPDDFLVMCGEEITTRNGHWLAAGLPAGTWIDWRYKSVDDELPRFTDLVRNLGGMAIAAHPWVPIPGTKWDFGYDYAAMDAIEIWNGPWTEDDQFGVAHWHALLAAGTFIPVVGNSDTHNLGQSVGRAQTVVRAEALSTSAIIAALKAGRSWLAESSSVALSFTVGVGGATYEIGDRAPAPASDLVDAELTVSGVPNCAGQIWGPAGPLGTAIADVSGNLTATVSSMPATLVPFLRAEVRRLDGTPEPNPLNGVLAGAMVAMTNPIFIGD
jgi:hypothetical protein